MAPSTRFIEPTKSRHPGWFEPHLFERVPACPIIDSTPGCLHDRAGHSRRSDESGSRSGGRNILGRTAHIDIQAVEAQLAHHLGRLIEQERILAVDLRDDRPFDFAVDQGVQEILGPPADIADMGKLRERHIRSPLRRDDAPERGIRHAVHGRQSNDRPRKVRPEAHVGISSNPAC